MRDLEDKREQIVLLDVSKADNSAQAIGLLESYVKKTDFSGTSKRISLLSGSLMLSQGVLSKMRQLCTHNDVVIDTVYSSVPQTQQAALDEGFYVKEKPLPSESKFSFDFSRPLEMDRPERKPFSSLGETFFQPAQSSVAKALEAADGINFNNFPFPAEPAPVKDVQNPVGTTNEEPVVSKLSSFDFPRSTPESRAKAVTPAVDRSEALPEIPGATYSWQEVERQAEQKAEKSNKETNPAPSTLNHTVGESQDADTELQTLYLKQNLRSGRVVRFDGNIVIVGDVHAGSEISAGGDITVWGELKGIAHAGNKGNYKAEIRALRIEAIQLRIADYIARRPDRIFYHKDFSGDTLWAELAKVADGEIKIVQEQIGR